MAGLMNQQHVPTLPIRSPLNESTLGAPIDAEAQMRACSDWLRATKRDAILLFISVHYPVLNVGLALTWTIEQFKNLLLPSVAARDLRQTMHRFSVDHGLPVPAVKPPPLPPQALSAQRPAEPLPVRASCDHETPVPRLSVSSQLPGLMLTGLLLVGLVSFVQHLLDEPPQQQTLQADAGYVQLAPHMQEIWVPPSKEMPKQDPPPKKPRRSRREHGADVSSGVVKVGAPMQTPAEPSSDGAARIVPVDTNYQYRCPGRRFIMVRIPGPPPHNGTPEAKETAKKARREAKRRCDEIAKQSQ